MASRKSRAFYFGGIAASLLAAGSVIMGVPQEVATVGFVAFLAAAIYGDSIW